MPFLPLRVCQFLFVLIPLALISGPLFPDLFIVISIFLIFFILDKNVITKFFTNKVFISLIILWIIGVFSSLLSTDILFSLKSSFLYLRFIIYLILIFILLNHDEKILKNLFYFLLVIFIFLFIDAFFQKINGFNLLGFEMFHEVRVSSLFLEELILGSYMVKFYPILVGLLFFYNKNKFYFFLISLITFLTVLISAEKSAIIIFLIEFYLILYFIKSSLSLKFLLSILPIILISLSLSFFPKVKDRLIHQYVVNTENLKFIYSKTHSEHAKTAYKIFKDNSSIGIGPKMFRQYCNLPGYRISDYSCSTHPHNYSMQFLSETGILGFLTYLVFFSFFIFDFFKLVFNKNKNKNEYNFLLFFLVMSNLINFNPLFPSGNFYNNWVSISCIVPLGIYLYIKINKKSSI